MSANVQRILREIRQLTQDERAELRQNMKTMGAPTEGDGRGRLQEHPSQLAIPAWLHALIELDNKGQSDAALDELFDRIDEMLSASEYEKVDSILANMPLEGPSLTLMMGVLSITRPAAEHLPSRVRYFDRVYRLCTAMRRDADSLLRGLK